MFETFFVRKDCADTLGWGSGTLGSDLELSPGCHRDYERKSGAYLDQFYGVCALEDGFLDREALYCLVYHIQLWVDGIYSI